MIGRIVGYWIVGYGWMVVRTTPGGHVTFESVCSWNKTLQPKQTKPFLDIFNLGKVLLSCSPILHYRTIACCGVRLVSMTKNNQNQMDIAS
jgi:hypothetical protein